MEERFPGFPVATAEDASTGLPLPSRYPAAGPFRPASRRRTKGGFRASRPAAADGPGDSRRSASSRYPERRLPLPSRYSAAGPFYPAFPEAAEIGGLLFRAAAGGFYRRRKSADGSVEKKPAISRLEAVSEEARKRRKNEGGRRAYSLML